MTNQPQQLDLLNQQEELFCPPAHGCAGRHAWAPEIIAGSFERCSGPAPFAWQPDRRCRCAKECPCHG